MRKNRENQMPLTPLWPDHRLGAELQMISRILDNNPEILHWVLQDLSDKADPCNGSPGLSAEQVVRCAVIKNCTDCPMKSWPFMWTTRRASGPSAVCL